MEKNNRKILACAAALTLAASAARAVSVSDGFPDQSSHHAATGTSAAPLAAFDSFVASRTSAASAIASFSSFVSTSVGSAALPKFRSDEPSGFMLIVR